MSVRHSLWTVLVLAILLCAPRESTAQGSNDEGLSRGQKVAIGAGIGGAVGGIVLGEEWLGKKLDVPHGLDIVIGAGIGAGVGALLMWAVSSGPPASAATPAANAAGSGAGSPLVAALPGRGLRVQSFASSQGRGVRVAFRW
jgi:hypothetical protein